MYIRERENQQIKVVAVNELAQPDAMAHLLQYDTSHGRFGRKVTNDQEHIYIHHDAPYEGTGEFGFGFVFYTLPR